METMNAQRKGARSSRSARDSPKPEARKDPGLPDPSGGTNRNVSEPKRAELALLEPIEQVLGKLIQLQLMVRSGMGGNLRGEEGERLRAGIPQKYLQAFDRLVRHGRTAVAKLSETGACGSCHLKLPAALASHIEHASDQVYLCPHCGCILYAAVVMATASEQVPGAVTVQPLVRTPEP